MTSLVNGHARGDVQLFVLSGTEAPELKELSNLPPGFKLLGTGRPDKECKSETAAAAMARMRDHVHTFRTVRRLGPGRLEQGGSPTQVWNRKRCIHETGARGVLLQCREREALAERTS